MSMRVAKMGHHSMLVNLIIIIMLAIINNPKASTINFHTECFTGKYSTFIYWNKERQRFLHYYWLLTCVELLYNMTQVIRTSMKISDIIATVYLTHIWMALRG